ncbi:uncharacterized protein LOC123876835 [Maniola jurtina]|uniref:uncharacterized protein LOC123876835 n=1 Tax=Maniola jurtina TaxID=191418 RepID=UPI001E685F63|nr:uncharacterized protein LOC123876835 [Maniola jurtina]
MAAKSPTTSVKLREMIGGDQFSQRREVFDKHDSAFVPLPSPPAAITTNHGATTSNFKRNTAGYSSMRETRSEDRHYDFRPRKYSDNFTSELNQSDDVDYRYSMAERNRRLSKLRRDFLKSNLHEPGEGTLTRSGVRASLPTTNTVSSIKYKIENINIYKFPFAEPYSTPTPTRRVVVDLGSPTDEGANKENSTPSPDKPKHQSLPNESPGSPKFDHQKLYEELVKRYSPTRKPVNWTLPPTRPKVVGSVPKSTSSAADSIDSTDKKYSEASNADTDEVFEKKEHEIKVNTQSPTTNENVEQNRVEDIKPNIEILHNGPEVSENEYEPDKKENVKKANDSKVSLSELEENDVVPELSTFKRQLSRESAKKIPADSKIVDLTIPALLEKMAEESERAQNHKTDGKKVKRKRSFLDKLLGRNKGVKTEKTSK